MADDDIRAVVPQHEHVTIDEGQFHTYQNLSHAARAFLDGEVSEAYLRHYVEELERLISLARLQNDQDPEHHTRT